MQGLTIRYRFLFGFLIVIVLTVAMAVFSVTVSRSILKRTVGGFETSLAEAMLFDMNNTVNLRMDLLHLIASRQSVRDGLIEANRIVSEVGDAGAYGVSPPDVAGVLPKVRNEELSEYLKTTFVTMFEKMYGYPVYMDLLLTNTDGVTVARTIDAGANYHGEDDWWLSAKEKGIYVGDAVSFEGITVLPVALSIKQAGDSVAGVLRAYLSMQEITRKSIIGMKSGQLTEARLVSESGKLIYSTEAFRPLEDVLEEDYYKKASSRSGYFLGTEGGEKFLYSYARSKRNWSQNQLPWTLVLSNQATEVLAPIRSLSTISYSAMGVVVVLCLLILFTLTRRVMFPILKMTRSAEIIRGGDLEHRVEISSKDELGVLAGVFNGVLDRIAGQTDALQKLSSELEVIIDSIPGLVFYKDTENNYIRVNKFVADSHKLSKEELEGKSCYEIYPRKQAEAYFQDDLEVINAAEPRLNIEEPWETESGNRWVSTSKIPYANGDGEIVGIIGVSMDITEQRQARIEIREKADALERQNWLRTGQAELNERMRGEKNIELLCRDIITGLSEYVGANAGAFYLLEDKRMRIAGRYAYRKFKAECAEFSMGEGLVGQAAVDGKKHLLKDVPEDYLVIGSALGAAKPEAVFILPVKLNGRVRGVIELCSLAPFSETQLELLDLVNESVAIAIQTANSRDQLRLLLEETQQQSEELNQQQEELRTANEELEESQERLKAQQEELEVTNEELEEKNDMLERQAREVEQAKTRVEMTAAELERTSTYKSEFLANMSHELRTPLNSLLLLAQSLSENKEGNLSEDQVNAAEIIYGSGRDLLSLINDILDLSKIEAGRMDVQHDEIEVADLSGGVHSSFDKLTEEKGIKLVTVVSPQAPATIISDKKHLVQIVRNFVSNAIKFTESGSITVTFDSVTSREERSRTNLDDDNLFSLSVKDTGIGIDPEKQEEIFGAFRQADGGTSRKYGGTGLGLSISRELAHLLGGEIVLKSEPGQGSEFTLYIPVSPSAAIADTGEDEVARGVQVLGASKTAGAARYPGHKKRRNDGAAADGPAGQAAKTDDDRDGIGDDDQVMLIIEDDPNFAKLLCEKSRRRGFKCIIENTGESGIETAKQYLPHGILLDVHLPGMDGLSTLSILKEDLRTRHIPVHVMSVDDVSVEVLRRGAVGFAAKPVSVEVLDEVLERIDAVGSNETKRVLVVEDDADIRRATMLLIEDANVTLDQAVNGADAIAALRENKYDCIILDLGLPDMDGQDLLKSAKSEGIEMPPVVVYTGRELSGEDEMAIREHTDSIVVKDARSRERLFDEVSLFLHTVVSRMPETKKQLIRNLHDKDASFDGKKVLIVDDDMRSTFALSRLLTDRGLKTLKAQNGIQALKVLDEDDSIDLVLMDIMMPEMDGYEAMRKIRDKQKFKRLPIIALTAKAMKEDREKCLSAGANDYMTKPVNQDQLISMLRIWLYR